MVSLVSLSYLSFLVYGNAINFCVLILYSATLSDSLMSSNSFMVVSLGFSRYNFMYLQIVWIPFISFSSLIAVARTSKLC